MGHLRKKFTGNTAEASSEPVPSQQRTPKSLKPVPKILSNSLNKVAPQIQEKKKKKKSVLESRKQSINNEKYDDESQTVIQMSTTRGEQDKKNQEDMEIKEKGAEWEKNRNQMDEKNHDQLESHQDEKKKENLDGRMIEEKHGQLESQQNERKKEELDGLQRKQHFGKMKEKSFNKTEHGQVNEEKHGQFGSQQNEKKKDKFGGVIFMCNAKTKPDCFRYSLMGVPMGKKDQVLGIKPGLKLFLYDFDLKLLYGIYTASSNGGMKLEPAAFGGAFPVQVRFSVYQDCYPLPESVFKGAIKENYNEKNWFNTELTDVQVEKLTKLFSSAEVRSHAPLMGPTPMPAIQDTNVNEIARESSLGHHHYFGAHNLRSYDEGRRYNGQHLMCGVFLSTERKEFPSEYEYRTYGGLRGERQNFTPTSQIAPPLEPHLGHERQHLLLHPGYLPPAQVQLGSRHNPHLVTENQPYALFPSQVLQSSTPLAATTLAKDSKTSYTYPYGGSYLDSYLPPSGRGGEVPLLRPHSFSGRGENVDTAMVYSTYASNALSEYNHVSKHQGVGPESSLAPVSARYSFAGPSLSHR